MVLTTRLWGSSSKDLLLRAHGHASINSIVSIYKCCQSSLNRFLQSLLLENRAKKYSSLRIQIFLSNQLVTCSLQWILVMLADHNFQTTWKLFLELWLWWCLTTLWSLKSPFILTVLMMPEILLERSQQHTLYVPNNYHHKTITITVWEQWSQSWQLQVTSNVNSQRKTSQF